MYNKQEVCIKLLISLKTFSAVFCIFDRFFYIYIFYRKFNAEHNKLMKTVGHRARLFEKWWTHPQHVWLHLDIFIFSLIKSLSC